MPEPDGGGLTVPLTPVRQAASDRRRARAVMVAVIAIAVVGIGLASRGDGDPGLTAAASPQGRGLETAAIGSAPSRSQRAASGRTERFLALPNDALTGAPTSIIVRRSGDDADILAWTPGDESLRSIRRFSGAFAGLPDAPLVMLRPDAGSLLIISLASPALAARDHARLIAADGRIAWDADAVNGLGGIAWSADSRRLAIAGVNDHWWLVSVDAAGHATARDVAIATQPAAGSPTPPPGERVAPIGFSADGRWVYGARFALGAGSIEPSIRLAFDTATTEPTLGFPSSGGHRLDPRALSVVDPATGRIVAYGPNAAIPGGPPSIEVRNPDGSIAFRVEGGVTLGALWTDDGRLIVADTDGIPFPSRIRLRSVAADGVSSPVLETGPVSGGWLIGAANGFVAMAFTTRRPDDALQFVMVRLADGGGSALSVPLDEQVLGSGLLP